MEFESIRLLKLSCNNVIKVSSDLSLVKEINKNMRMDPSWIVFVRYL
jgi:hypothetical protein